MHRAIMFHGIVVVVAAALINLMEGRQVRRSADEQAQARRESEFECTISASEPRNSTVPLAWNTSSSSRDGHVAISYKISAVIWMMKDRWKGLGTTNKRLIRSRQGRECYTGSISKW